MALIRQKQLTDPQNCMSCGEPEVEKVANNFIPRAYYQAFRMAETGLNFKDEYQKSLEPAKMMSASFTAKKRPRTASTKHGFKS